jgi:chromosome segregation ATPase
MSARWARWAIALGQILIQATARSRVCLLPPIRKDFHSGVVAMLRGGETEPRTSALARLEAATLNLELKLASLRDGGSKNDLSPPRPKLSQTREFGEAEADSLVRPPTRSGNKRARVESGQKEETWAPTKVSATQETDVSNESPAQYQILQQELDAVREIAAEAVIKMEAAEQEVISANRGRADAESNSLAATARAESEKERSLNLQANIDECFARMESLEVALDSALKEVESANESRAQIEEKLAAVSSREEHKAAQVQHLENELDSTLARMETLQMTLDSALEEAASAENRSNESLTKLARAEAQAIASEDTLVEKVLKMVELEDKIKELTAAKATADEMVKTLELQLASRVEAENAPIGQSNRDERAQELEALLASFQAKEQKLRASIDELTSSSKEADAQVLDLQQQLSTLKESKSSPEKGVESSSTDRHEAGAEREEILTSQITNLTKELQEAQALSMKAKVFEVEITDLRMKLEKSRSDESRELEKAESMRQSTSSALPTRKKSGGSIFGGGRILRIAAWAPVILLSIATLSSTSNGAEKLLEVSLVPPCESPLPNWGSGRLRTKIRRWLSERSEGGIRDLDFDQ